ncbi:MULTISPECIES: DNA gyrase/topoisomerase IV subunit A [unclassified Mucilaginibacter]|uniref:DNA gyrase/topoisomerase IV subunit A n=1 Tax=unclassified Mucilaginibacter TaxID=2617802 RepID=UPI002AC97A9C|nr:MULTISPECIES: DNA gyrase/topoisomerase IV subunit A [unclassified Mucilaginibacter]MEB0262452.1 DNA gyrase/topoisomerase IV subunit A [Mucilaginibacter sp. 10I4]MEB0279277.1 DNA gyrase/topoisomerase IV subunit A [Mucilaginibacter sp. 10B2]MEB0302585.1 DNA gyrase/topoisomerase IV subunit A [Mucilaginibacter sp. 5C4]WPX23211.1 DNA gyrase/topoisomerase IV subunit A [Mucilaginibacter sp. 5C4]
MSDDLNTPDIPESNNDENKLNKVTSLDGLYENWFLDYASYVILDRAVPHLNDGLKPVQRRILHSLKEMDDGRFNKAANVIGNTMKYHPHGDASIGDAMVQIGQKNLLIDCQGNWGDPITGDSAAAPRYIEARLSKFALDVVFNADTTVWQASYDGRNREPITLPVKFPLLLAQGAEGIAVGLATKILPHNFIELIDASIAALTGVRPNLLPDFPTGGMADASAYNEGQRGGKVRVRAKIVERDKKTLAITEVPFTTTTGSLIDSVISANDKGKIKIKKIEDNTAQDVEIVIHLAPGISPDVTIDALYAFTDCEVSISPNTCVIQSDKPRFMSVNDMLTESTFFTKELLKQELEIKLKELMEKIFFSSLLKIFIQEGMYKHPDYEQSSDFEGVLVVLNRLFELFFPQFYRTILPEDYKKLIDKPMSSITRFDVKKTDEQIKALEAEIKVVKNHLKHLTDYTIAWFEKLREKYGKDRGRKTELRTFDRVEASQVALANVKLYVNREDGFIGSGLKKDEFVCDCSDIDEIIVFRGDGKFVVTKVQDKVFVGKDIEHVAVFKKNDERTVYNMIYKDGQSGVSYIKRFSVTGVTRDKEYDLTKGSKGSKTLYFTANPNGEAEIINVQLKPHQKLKKLQFDEDFAAIAIKGRASIGNIVTKYPVKKVILKSKGISTLAGRKIWYDEILKRLNADGRGKYLGEFDGDDRILNVLSNGNYELTSFDLNNHFDDKMIIIEKYDAAKIFAVVHYDGKSKNYMVKRFVFENTVIGKQTSIISDESGSKLVLISGATQPIVKIEQLKGKTLIPEEADLNLTDLIDVKGMKAMGNRLSVHQIKSVELLAEHDDEADVPDPAPDSVEDTEITITGEDKEVTDTASVSPIVAAPQSEPKNLVIEQEKPTETAAIKPEVPSEESLKSPEIKSVESPKKIDFEITNPDDIDIDDKGQLGLF